MKIHHWRNFVVTHSPRFPKVPGGVPLLQSGDHFVMVGSPAIDESGDRTVVRFIVSGARGAARSRLLLHDLNEQVAMRDLALLKRLLTAAGRNIQAGDRGGVVAALSGLRANVRLRVQPSGYAVIMDVLS